MKNIVSKEKKTEFNVKEFLKNVRKYSEIEGLTMDILKEFIDKIVVYHFK